MTDAAAGTAIPADAKPRLPRGVRLTHNEAQGGWVLLAPERVFKADAVAVEILKRCTGEATFAAIVDDLAASFQRAARTHRNRCRRPCCARSPTSGCWSCERMDARCQLCPRRSACWPN